ncbi:desmoglein-2-like protein [Tachysurus vachellii]|uniref:desmoglein-2-like protein n=1 Tax=Tachysurus vachellii TaxID=175792 RepID=UPI00296B133A|nr:desmoglein-2-like protein [Tachysurus vachellii]
MTMFLTFCIFITMFSTTVTWVEAGKTEPQTLRRQKRDWIIPPKTLFENVDYTKEEYIAKIRSDEETRTNVKYSLIGPAADKRLFSVNENNGNVKIHGILDREEEAEYELKGRAVLPNGTLAEKDLDLKIIVLDQNDNAPEFNLDMKESVKELSDKGTMVFTATATDKDQDGSPYSKIAYKIIHQDPEEETMFEISRTSGEIKVRMNTLDREKQETYKLIITATDMDGEDNDPNNTPSTGTGTVTISILDVNDNIPTLENKYYEGNVEENLKNKEVIRIKTIDKDQEYTENWEAVYTIISGNEASYFNITTDPKTNEGILMVIKDLNYEEFTEISLKVVVNNKAPYHKSVVNDKIVEYPIKIKVLNVREGHHFNPHIKVVSVSEDTKLTDLTKVITTFKATDTDTSLPATNVRYLKHDDVGHWVSIDEQTGDIKLINYPDYEFKELKNGRYNVKIIAITNDFPFKTATGTLVIQVENINDNSPILANSFDTMCYGSKEVYVTAKDGDHSPYAEPFIFTLVTKDTEKWSLDYHNATTHILRSKEENLWPGLYTVNLVVKDNGGKFSEVQKLQLTVCTCRENTNKPACQSARQSRKGTVLGAGGALTLLIGILLLVAIPLLLLVCECGTRPVIHAFPFNAEQQLIKYNTEGQGEDKELALLPQMHVTGEGGSSGKQEAEWGAGWGAGWGAHEHWSKYGWESEEEYINWCLKHAYNVNYNATGNNGQSKFFTASTLDSMALSEAFLREYYSMKSCEITDQEADMNQLLVYDNEDLSSVTSSLNENYIIEDKDLDFLNDLGPKFKMLAEICLGSAMEPEVSSSPTPDITVSSSSQVGVNVKGAVDVLHNEATSVSASSSSSTTQTTTKYYAENVSSGGATSAATVGQTLFIQQPPVYLSSTHMYVAEQQRQPALFLASGQILGVQEQNVVLVEKGATNMAIADQNTLPGLHLQHANTRVLVDPGIGGTLVRGFSGRSEPQGTVSGAFCVVESQRVESTEPAHVMQSSSHSSIRKSQHIQIEDKV